MAANIGAATIASQSIHVLALCASLPAQARPAGWGYKSPSARPANWPGLAGRGLAGRELAGAPGQLQLEGRRDGWRPSATT